jgi:hypothetical protein
MKFHEKRRKGSESFLSFWSSKVQELESIEDNNIDDDTKRVWLTNSLLGQRELNDAVRQAITTERTISGMGKCATTQVSWTHFYHIVMSTAKNRDTSTKVNANYQRESHRAKQDHTSKRGSGYKSGRNL